MSKYMGFAVKGIAQSDKNSDKEWELSTNAATKVTKNKNEKIRVLILVTQNEDFLFPSTAFVVHKELHLSQYCMVYDINLGGDGFLTAFELACGLLSPFDKETEALIIAADREQAVAAIVGREERASAWFNHYSRNQDWDIAFMSRWNNEYIIKKDCFRIMVTDVYERFMSANGQMTDDVYVVAPQRAVLESKGIDSPVLIPMELMKSGSGEVKGLSSFLCLACGAGGSVTEAGISMIIKERAHEKRNISNNF